MRPTRRLMLLAAVLALALGGCAALSGSDSGVYAGGDAGAHKDFR
jgi:hypothetical protein